MNFWQTSRIRLRAVEPSDAETFHRWNLDSERARFLDFTWPPTSLELVKTWVGEQSRKRLEQDGYQWVIETLSSQPVGSITTHTCDPHNGTFSYGVDIAAEERGKGYAGEAVYLILRYYFDELRYQKVTVMVHADNTASIRLHEKLGFRREGVLRKMVFQQGRYIDALYYGLTVEEFHKLNPPAQAGRG